MNVELPKKINIIIPVLNEKDCITLFLDKLNQSLAKIQSTSKYQWHVYISDAGSQDGTAQLIQTWLTQRQQKKIAYKLISNKITNTSIGKTINQTLTQISPDFILILPCDTYLDSLGFQTFENAIHSQGLHCGGFQKKYDLGSMILKAFQIIQNIVVSRITKTLCWTHGIFFHASCLKEHKVPETGFLEDIILSDQLKKHPKWGIARYPLLVSARRYIKDGVLKRVILNLTIYFLYRTRCFSPKTLHKAYKWL